MPRIVRRRRQVAPWSPVGLPPFGARNTIVTMFDASTYKLDPKLAKQSDPGRIRCPHCTWQPKRSSRWLCAPAGPPEMFSGGCGTTWNTFDTRGRCPGCTHQWRHTSCLKCQAWALHDDWYVKDGDGKPE